MKTVSSALFQYNPLTGPGRRCWLRPGGAGADTILMACPFLETCSMFRTIMADDETEYLAWAFCRTLYQDCGRYKKAVSGQDVPEGLLPTGDLVAISGKK